MHVTTQAEAGRLACRTWECGTLWIGARTLGSRAAVLASGGAHHASAGSGPLQSSAAVSKAMATSRGWRSIGEGEGVAHTRRKGVWMVAGEIDWGRYGQNTCLLKKDSIETGKTR